MSQSFQDDVDQHSFVISFRLSSHLGPAAQTCRVARNSQINHRTPHEHTATHKLAVFNDDAAEEAKRQCHTHTVGYEPAYPQFVETCVRLGVRASVYLGIRVHLKFRVCVCVYCKLELQSKCNEQHVSLFNERT